MKTIEEYKTYIIEKHAGQIRKFSGLPYHTHPFAVCENVCVFVELIKDEFKTDKIKNSLFVGALSHDVAEDCYKQNVAGYQALARVIYPMHDILDPDIVMKIIRGMTKPERGGNSTYRHLKYMAQMMNFDKHVMTVKLCDIDHNTESYTNDLKLIKDKNEVKSTSWTMGKYIEVLNILKLTLDNNTIDFSKNYRIVALNKIDEITKRVNSLLSKL